MTKKRINNSIKFYRVNAGLRQVDLAKKIGVGVNAIVSWERFEKVPQYRNIVKLAELFGVNPEDIMK